MSLTKAEMLAASAGVGVFKIPKFFYFKVGEFKKDADQIFIKVSQMFQCRVAVRSSSMFEDGTISSAAVNSNQSSMWMLVQHLQSRMRLKKF